MPRSAVTGVYTRVSNSFSNPVFGTLIDPTDADAYFDDLDVGLNPAELDGPVRIIDKLQVGTTGTAAGTIEFFNATSGSITVSPPAGALGSVTMTLPDATDTFVGRTTTDTFTGVKTFGTAGNVGKLVIAGTTSGSTVLNATAIASGTLTLPAATDTLMGRDTADTINGIKQFADGKLILSGLTSGATTFKAAAIAGTTTVTLPGLTDTLVSKTSTDTLTNKTFDTAGAGNSFSINSVAVTANTGTGAVARAAGPTFTTPALGVATGTSLALNGATIGANDLATAGTALFGGNATVQKNQNATTTFTLANTDTTDTNSRSLFTFTAGSVGARFLGISGNSFVVGTTSAHPISFQANNASSLTLDASTAVFVGAITNSNGTATPAGGSTAARLLFGTTAAFGIYYGSGAPTVSAAQGSLYIRSDGSSTSTRLYVNTTGSTTWTNFTSAA